MSQALTPPVAFADNPDGFDGVISEIQYTLESLEWLDYSLGRVKPQVINGKLEPWVQPDPASKEYYKAYPNDELSSFSCLYLHDDEETVNHIFQNRTLSVIVWINMERVFGDLAVYNTKAIEHLKKDVRRLLTELECVVEILETRDQTATGAEGIYPGFDLSEFEERYLTYPYAGFRIDAKVYFADLCG